MKKDHIFLLTVFTAGLLVFTGCCKKGTTEPEEKPAAPVLIGPLDDVLLYENTPVFDWDDVSGASVYELEVDNSSSFNSPEIYQNNLTNSAYTASSSLSDGTYYWRVRCKDSQGNWGEWSSTWSFTIETAPSDTVTDIDGNVYQTIQIGNQWWTAENLKVTHYRNGDAIPNVTSNSEWINLATGAYCAYNNNESNTDIYGYLYNWYTINDSRNIAPAGWHVPTDEEWKELEMVLGMSQLDADGVGYRGTDEGGKLKETGTTHWASPNTGATNESGFSALPCGSRGGNDGSFYNLGFFATFWLSTELNGNYAWLRHLYYDYSFITRHYTNKQYGFSIRLVRD